MDGVHNLDFEVLRFEDAVDQTCRPIARCSDDVTLAAALPVDDGAIGAKGNGGDFGDGRSV